MRIAVTGSNGFVGGNIAHVLKLAGHEVLGLVRSEPEKELPWPTKVVDLDDIQSIASAIEGFDAIVHSAIANDFNRLLRDRVFAYDVFVALTQRVTHAANISGAQMIYISTGWVMDGTERNVVESNPGNPVNFYGVLKSLGEQVIRDLAPDTGAIARIEGVMGVHQTQDSGPRAQDVGFGYFVTTLVSELRAGKTFTVFSGAGVNKFTAPSAAAEAGAEIERIISRKAAGTFHLVGDDVIERMDYAKLACEIFDLDSSKLLEAAPGPEDTFTGGAVPFDTSLSNTETKQRLGLGKTSLRDLLIALRTEIDTGVITFLTQPEQKK